MKFKQLNVEKWKQFERIQIDFHDKVTVLTGANGAGKTTILNILALHFNWPSIELSTPSKDSSSGVIRFFKRLFKKGKSLEETNVEGNEIGSIVYTSNQLGKLSLPTSDQAQYQIRIVPKQSVKGLNIPSHRPVFRYQPVTQIALGKRNKQKAYNLVLSSSKNRTSGNQGKPSNYHIKETLLMWNIFGYGNKEMVADEEYMSYYEGYQEVLKGILPKSLGFKKFAVRKSEIVMITDSGDFMIDSSSGGISSLIDLSWQIYMFETNEKTPFTVLIDEVENHLHATLQREIIPNLTKTFPHVQFIVSTHSPLIIGSVKDSNVYALQFDESNLVVSQKLDLINKAQTASQILDKILGVSFTMPIWVESQLREIVQKYVQKEFDENTFTSMRQEFIELGLEELMPLATKELIDKK